jgi:rhodanese-related sulfurtransferase
MLKVKNILFTYLPFNIPSSLILFIVLFSTECANLSTIPSEMEPAQVSRLLETNQKQFNLVIIDVRTQKEFDESHIENAINIDFYSNTFKRDLKKLDKTKNYLICCRSGNRSAQTQAIMKEMGFGKVAFITGGIIKWENEGFRTVTTTMELESK